MKNVDFWDVATCRSETSVHTRSTRRHIPQVGILQIILNLFLEYAYVSIILNNSS
jgi:hypothetical protein